MSTEAENQSYLPILDDGYEYKLPFFPVQLEWEWMDPKNDCRCKPVITWYLSPKNFEVSLKRYTADSMFPDMGYFYDFGENHDYEYFELSPEGLAKLYLHVKEKYVQYFTNSGKVSFTWGRLWKEFYTEKALEGSATAHVAYSMEHELSDGTPSQVDKWVKTETEKRPAPKLRDVLPDYVPVAKPREAVFEKCRELVRG